MQSDVSLKGEIVLQSIRFSLFLYLGAQDLAQDTDTELSDASSKWASEEDRMKWVSALNRAWTPQQDNFVAEESDRPYAESAVCWRLAGVAFYPSTCFTAIGQSATAVKIHSIDRPCIFSIILQQEIPDDKLYLHQFLIGALM